MRDIKEWVKIVDCKALPNSLEGGARWKVFVETKDKQFCLTTKRNNPVGLLFSSTMVGSAKMIRYYKTRAGNYIMTDIEVNKKWTVWYESGFSNDRYYFKDRETYKAFCKEVLGYKNKDFEYDSYGCDYVTCHYRNEVLRNKLYETCNIVGSHEELILGE